MNLVIVVNPKLVGLAVKEVIRHVFSIKEIVC